MKEIFVTKYPYFGIASLLYGIVYVICMYNNPSGITYPIFVLATLAYFILCFTWLDIKLKKDAWFYMLAIELFGISTCITGDMRIIKMNKLAIFFLTLIFIIHQLYDDKKWDFAQYAYNIICSIFRSFSCINRPVSDGVKYLRNKRNDRENIRAGYRKFKYIIIGIVASIPIALVVLILLVSSDEIFADIVVNIISFDFIIKGMFDISDITINVIIVFFISYMFISFMGERKLKEQSYRKNTFEAEVGITIAVVLSVLYLVFCIIQIRYLFIGGISGEMILPHGMTYSSYARTGFFQLLFVSIINVIIVLVGIYGFKESKVLKGLMLFITLCTYIMIASSAFRMVLYIQYKYLTFLRLFVLLLLLIIAVIMAGVIACILNKSFPLFKFCMIVSTVFYLIFSFSRPDYFIAKVNIDNMSAETQYNFFKGSPLYDDVDLLLEEVGTDAAKIIINDEAREGYEYFKENYKSGYYNKEEKKEYFRYLYMEEVEEKTQDIGIRSFNFSEYFARKLMEQ